MCLPRLTIDQLFAAGQLDYDIDAEGEAELGCLNCRLAVTASESFSLDRLLVDLVHRARGSLTHIGAETAHLKVIGLWQEFHGVANLISSDSPGTQPPSPYRLTG